MDRYFVVISVRSFYTGHGSVLICQKFIHTGIQKDFHLAVSRICIEFFLHSGHKGLPHSFTPGNTKHAHGIINAGVQFLLKGNTVLLQPVDRGTGVFCIVLCCRYIQVLFPVGKTNDIFIKQFRAVFNAHALLDICACTADPAHCISGFPAKYAGSFDEDYTHALLRCTDG